MATYVMLSTLTDDGRETIQERPERIGEVNQEVERLGARVVAQYAVLGPYDFVNIVEAPDNATITRVSVALSARGTVQFLTLPAFAIDEFIAMVAGGQGERRRERGEGRQGREAARDDRGQQDAGTPAEGNANPIQVQKFLGGVDYPAGKADLIRIAEQEGADEHVRATLARLPERQYDSPVAVSEALGQRG